MRDCSVLISSLVLAANTAGSCSEASCHATRLDKFNAPEYVDLLLYIGGTD